MELAELALPVSGSVARRHIVVFKSFLVVHLHKLLYRR